MRKTLWYGWLVLKLSFEANQWWAILAIVSKVYQHTLYPFIQVYLLANLLDKFTQRATLGNIELTFTITTYIIATLLNIVLSRFSEAKENYLHERLYALLDHKIIHKLTTLDPATFESPGFQSLLAQLEGVKGTLQAHLIKFTRLISLIVQFITATIVVSAVFPHFVLYLTIAAIPIYIAWNRAQVRSWPYYVEKHAAVIRLTQYIKGLLSADSTSKESAIFNTGNILLHKVDSHRDKYFKGMDKAVTPGMYEILLASIVQFCVFLYTQFLTLSAVLRGSLSVGQFALIFQQTLNLATSAEEILSLYSNIDARTKYIDKFFEFLNTPRAITSPKKPATFVAKPQPPVIEFRNVSFKYPNTERYILKNFNVTITSGEKIALVGENGAGKTTIIKLLLRFYDVSEGSIFINGLDIKTLSLEEWYKQVGALFQDFIRYQFTFKENIYFGDLSQKHSLAKLQYAIKKSGASTYLKTLPKGTEQVLGKMFEEGVDLSGGQWQKLALARAFFKDAPILILDEPTSAIDAKAEYEIFQNVQKLQKDKTVIIISHRFSTVRNADRILVLDEGKIIEEGSHTMLIKKKGIYAELFNIQAQGYK